MSLARDAATGVRWNAVAMVGTTFLQTLTLLILARLLDPSDFGLLAMMVLVTGFASLVSTMGLSEAVIQRTETTEGQLHSLYWANLALGSIAFALVWIAAPVAADVFDESSLVELLRLVAATLIINAAGAQFRALLQKELQFRKIALVNLSAVIAGSFTAIALAILDAGVWALAWGQIANAATATAALGVIAVKHGWLPALYFRLSPIRGHLSFGAYLFGSNVANYVVSRSDQLIIGAALGSRQLGFYSMAFNLVVRPTTMVNPVLTQVAFPVLSLLQHDTERTKRAYLRMLRILTAVNAPVLLGFAAISPIVIPWLLGEKWTSIVLLVQILAAYALLRSAGNAGGSLVRAAGRASWAFYWNLALLGIIPAAVWVSAEVGGLKAVAYTLVAVQAALFFVWYLLLVRPLLGKCFEPYVSSVSVPVGFALVMVASVAGVSELTNTISPAITSAGLAVIGASVYFGLYWRYQQEDLTGMLRLLFGREKQ